MQIDPDNDARMAAEHQHETELLRQDPAFLRWLEQLDADTHRNPNMTDLNNLTFDELVPSQSKYLAKSDVGEDGLILTVRGFRQELVKGDDGDEDKIVLYFVEDVKPMILNRTNAALLSQATGAAKAGDAKGKQIVVFNDASVSFGGRVTGGLRIKRVVGAPKPAKPAASSASDPNDDVPF